ncbi:MAG: DUF5985 family protein [Actinomycetota bacterium]
MIDIPEPMTQFIHGATTLANLLVSVYFLRFWHESRDRLFAIFSVAFFIFAGNRILLSVLDTENEVRTFVYVLRLIAFLLIIVGVVDKNRPSRGDADDRAPDLVTKA